MAPTLAVATRTSTDMTCVKVEPVDDHGNDTSPNPTVRVAKDIPPRESNRRHWFGMTRGRLAFQRTDDVADPRFIDPQLNEGVACPRRARVVRGKRDAVKPPDIIVASPAPMPNLEPPASTPRTTLSPSLRSSAGSQKSPTLSISDFTMVSKLGEGGFGTVMLVRKKVSGSLFALKVLAKRKMTHRGVAESVISESESLKEIRHPFVVALHYAFQDKDCVYFVLEHVEGGDLFTHLQEHRRFPEQWCRLYLAEVALALAWVHKHRYVYRDLKPENILVASDGHLKLADFGTAKRLPETPADDVQTGGGQAAAGGGDDGGSRSSSLHTIVGTPAALAPELFLERGYSFSVDWWGLGALFSEMLLGRCSIASGGNDADLCGLIQLYSREAKTRSNFHLLHRSIVKVAT